MEIGMTNSEYWQWRVEEVERGSNVDASIEIILGLYEHHDCLGRFRFQYNKSEDGVGTIYIPGRKGCSFDDKDAARDNQAAFAAAQAVAEATGTVQRCTFIPRNT